MPACHMCAPLTVCADSPSLHRHSPRNQSPRTPSQPTALPPPPGPSAKGAAHSGGRSGNISRSGSRQQQQKQPLHVVLRVSKLRFNPLSVGIERQALCHWAPTGSQSWKPSWEPLAHLSGALRRDPDVRRMEKQLDDTGFEFEKALDHREDSDGNFEYLVKWRGYPSSQATWESAIIMSAADAAAWWGQPTIEKDQLHPSGEYKFLLRWETAGATAYEAWYISADVAEMYPEQYSAWGDGALDRHRDFVWLNGGTHSDPYVSEPKVLADCAQPVWQSIIVSYCSMIWNLYLECIKADRARNPAFKIRMPELVFKRWMASVCEQPMTKLVVKYVKENEEMENQPVEVSMEASASLPKQQVPSRSINIDDLPLHPVQSACVELTTAAELGTLPDAPLNVKTKQVFKQVWAMEWDSIQAATTLMGGHNPHKPVAVKPAATSISWKWYRVVVGDVKAEYDGTTLTFTSFPIEAYQSKITNGRATPDYTQPILTTTKRRRVDTTL